MFEALEKLEGMFDNWYSKGYLLLGVIGLIFFLIWLIFKVF